MNFAIIPAAGPIMLDKRPGRTFPKPRALLSLGEETVIQRLVRQAKNAGFEILVAINQVGMGGWTPEHVREFEQLDCRLYTSPAGKTKRAGQTMAFLLQKILEDPGLRDDSIIFEVNGDWIYSEGLFKEVLSYRRPCFFTFQRFDWGYLLNGRNIPGFLELLRDAKSGAAMFRRHVKPHVEGQPAPVLNYRFQRGPLKEMGFEIYKRYEYPPSRVAEIDYLSQWEIALDLVAKERGKRRVFVSGCWDLFHIGHLRRLEGAKREGDYLLVGVSTEAFTRTYKHEPVMALAQRMEIVSGLKCVDFVIPHADLQSEIPFHDFRCNVRVVGEEWGYLGQRHVNASKMMKNFDVEVISHPRTPDISTAAIREGMYHEALTRLLDSVVHSLGMRSPEEAADLRCDPQRG